MNLTDARVRKRSTRAAAPEENAVLDHEPLAEKAELLGEPPVHGHVGEHAGSAEEAGLCCREEEDRLGKERERHEESAHGAPALGEPAEQGGVQCLARLVAHIENQVPDHQARGQKSQGKRHVAHGGLGRLDPGLAKDRHGIAHRFDPGECPRPHPVRAEYQKQDPEGPRLRRGLPHLVGRPGGQHTELGNIGRDGVNHGDDVHDDENQKYRCERHDGFPDASEVQQDEENHTAHRNHELQRLVAYGQ